MTRIALLFDNSHRPETTGFYVRRAIGETCDVEHFLPTEFEALAHGHHGRFDLYLAVDDGLDYRLPRSLRPLAFWAIDTHVSFAQVLMKAEECDFVFAAQKHGAERLRRAGIDSAVWLPLACDPALHRPHAVPNEFDVAFVGNILLGPRAELLQRIRERHPRSFIGQRYGEAMARTYSASRLAFNRSVADDVNMRVFEALACGSMLVTNDLEASGQERLFRNGQHLVTYSEADDLFEKIDWHLQHDAERERIAAAGRHEVLARHTYRHRVEAILRTVEGRSRSFAVPAAPPPAAPTSRSDAPRKDGHYYEFARPDVLALIPESCRRVLDIGCGAGRLGEALKQRQDAIVVGIELHPQAAQAATSRLDEVIAASIEDESLDFQAGRFDCVVCADVLEHLRQPERLLPRIRRWLAPGGCLVASIPNLQHHTVVTSLLAGNFTYETAGLLDETHLRFFTRREIEKLFFRAGFEIESLQSVPGPEDGSWWAGARSGPIDLGGLQIAGLEAARAREFFTYQYLVAARPAPTRKDGLTSIVLVTHNQLEYTRLCLDSIRRYTDEPYELIVIDNGSADGTVPFLRSCPDIRRIENAENRGFPAAVNQALAIARGEQVLLLNNDTLVTTGWLRRMLDVLNSDERIGLVGPASNKVSGPQQVPVSYSQLSDLDGFAWDWGRAHEGQSLDLDRLVGFCLLIRRPVVDRIGLLDERFGIGNFEDDDYCRRAIEAGFRCVVARDSFIHHFGGRTFVGSGVDFASLMAENEQKYRDKWSVRSQTASRGRLAAPSEPASSSPPRPKISLCMIVRDNAQTIVPCLESIRPWVDEMIVVDTGSTDRTPELCRQLGAKVFHFPWCDNFSAARNESLKHATGEWIFWMDSDDTIPDQCGRMLRRLGDGQHPEHILGWVLQVHCPAGGGDAASDVTIVDHIKLFRNRPDLRFEHRIHEQILPAIRRAGGEVLFTDIHVVHSGSDHTPEGRARKLERDFRLLELDLKERPDHPFVLFNFGMTYGDAGRHEEAVAALKSCLAVSTPEESHVRKAYALLTSSLAQIDAQEAMDICQHALQLFPDDAELLFRQALLQHDAGALREAAQSYQRLLRQAESEHRFFKSRDEGLGNWKALHNLALVYEDLGEIEAALSAWRELFRERQWDWPLGAPGGSEDASQNDRRHERHYESMPQEPLRALSRLAFAREDWLAAQSLLKHLRELAPNDASVHHNLGTATWCLGDAEEAASHFQRSIELRPDSPTTIRLLGQVLRAKGRHVEAHRTWLSLLRLVPDDEEARSVIESMRQEFPGIQAL